MEPLLKSDLPQYFVLEGPSPSLQVILAPGQSLRTSLNYITYLSKSLSVKQISTLRSRFIKCKSQTLPYNLNFKVKNKTGGVEYIGLASASQQATLAVNPEVLHDDLVARPDTILGMTNEVSIEMCK